MRTFILILLVAGSSVPLAAQVRETPVPFDSAGRVPAITQPLAERLHLAPPGWPVLGSFASARLYEKSTGGYVLVVVRPDGALDRYDLTAEDGMSLRGVVQSALASGRRAGVGEQTDVASEPAGNAFVRNQTALGLFIYGPSAAVLIGDSNDGSTAAAAELLTAGAAFAIAMARRNAQPPVTTAQNHLSSHAAVRGFALGLTTTYIADVNDHATAGLLMLGGSLGGTVVGMRAARRMTDAEAASSAYAADFATAATAGTLGATGVISKPGTRRTVLAVTGTAMIGGYLIGPMYARRASYTVTAGDVRALTAVTAIGIAAAATPLIDAPHAPGTRTIAGALTAGMIAGAVVGDRWLVRPRDHTRADGTLLWTGAGVGALVGGGVATLGDAGQKAAWVIAVTGAILGTAATEAAIRPPPGGRRILADDAGAGGVSVSFDPVGAAFAATKHEGKFPIVRVTF